MGTIDYTDYGPYMPGAKKVADISYWQWGIDNAGNRTLSPNFDGMAQQFDGIIIRAGSINNVTGNVYTDYKFQQNYAGIKGKFSRIGAYWFLRLNWDVHSQARYFANLVKGKGFHALVADAETPGARSQLFAFLNTLKNEVNEDTEYWIYTGPNAWNNLIVGDKTPAKDYGLWEAHYQVNTPMALEPWFSLGISRKGHQFTDNGPGTKYNVQSLSIDLNWMNPNWFEETSPPPPQPETVEVTASALNVRTQPLVTTSTKIGSVPRGTRFEVVERQGKWVGVKTWVHGDFVKEV